MAGPLKTTPPQIRAGGLAGKLPVEGGDVVGAVVEVVTGATVVDVVVVAMGLTGFLASAGDASTVDMMSANPPPTVSDSNRHCLRTES